MRVSLLREFETFIHHARTAKGLSPWSIQWYMVSFKNLLTFLTLNPRVSVQNFGEAWIAWNRTRIAATTVNTYFRGVHAFFKFRRKRFGKLDPLDDVRPPRFPRKLPKALTTEQCRAVLSAAKQLHWKSHYVGRRALALVATVLYAGLRRNELLELALSDVDLAEGTIRIRKGKGEKERVAYIPPPLGSILRSYLRSRGQSTQIQFFLGSRKNAPLGLRALRNTFDTIAQDVGFPCSPHRLRHSFVTQMLKCGIPLQAASELAGHASVVTTMGYVRLWSEDQRRYAAMIRY